jgi:2-iminobutanoate/2-iminopropanoate deaminase
MEMQSRRGILANAARAAAAVFGGSMLASKATAQAPTPPSPLQKRNATELPGVVHNGAPLPFTSVVGFGNLLFLSGIGCPNEGTIEEQTNWVIDQIEKNLTAAGSSLQKVLKIDIYLEDMKSYDRMNAVYKTRNWGAVFPARNTVSPAALPASDRGLAVDCIAYV